MSFLRGTAAVARARVLPRATLTTAALRAVKATTPCVSASVVTRRSNSTSPSNFSQVRDVFSPLDTFPRRHIGPSDSDASEMLQKVGVSSLEELTEKAVPSSIREIAQSPNLGEGMTEQELLTRFKNVAQKNKVLKSYLGMGYTNTVTPKVILRNILENPGWYTQYTPYQPEISQGRLESLVNYQTAVSDLTGLPISNASLLDEGTAAAEAMALAFSNSNRKKTRFFVDSACHPQTIACVRTRADAIGVEVVVGDFRQLDFTGNTYCGVLVQYPATDGKVIDYSEFASKVHANGALFVVAADLLSLTVLKPPGEFGADIALGNTQRFGVPMGFGGPHAAFFACKDEFKRKIPGRIIGVSVDAKGKSAYRLALQTREQHIRREKATSNICTSQALLANMVAMYAVYHGPQGVREIAHRVHNYATIFAAGVKQLGYQIRHDDFFDTVAVELRHNADDLVVAAEQAGMNIRKLDVRTVSVTMDESVTKEDLVDLLRVFASRKRKGISSEGSKQPLEIPNVDELASKLNITTSSPAPLPAGLERTSPILTHPIFNQYHSETEMLRYINRLQAKDLSLVNAMIPLGSCTMKLNATTEMIPVTWPEFSNIHPFVPKTQALGYHQMIEELEYELAEITGFDAVSLQPNSGAQGEYAGLRVIKAYLQSKGQGHRNICLIPVSAHGTNPASAQMAGFEVVTVKCDKNGNLDMEDVKLKADRHKANLAAIMVTYPSTFGVFEDGIVEACKIIHENGGQVYMDGANLNAQVAVCRPGDIGADVCHLNLHKTFCIPHGGGGPGMGPIGCKSHLAPFLPGHPVVQCGGDQAIGPISAAPWGSASILTISYAYIKMMGKSGLRKATQTALLNANYMAKILAPHYNILYTNKNGMCAHEFIIDIRPFQEYGIEAIDIAKRLQDYGFHSPTMSWPVPNTLMIEPTESESRQELDRFCSALLQIRKEIDAVKEGKYPKDNNPLVNAPHPIHVILSDSWDKPYTRKEAAYPLPYLEQYKFWPSVSRLDDAYGDRNLICTCPPLETYEK